MPEQGLSLATDEALVLVALPGVQQFIVEARSTSDVAGASKIYVALGSLIARTVRDLGGRLVFPSSLDETSGITNKVVALFAAGGPSILVNQAEVVDALRVAVEAKRREWLRATFELDGDAVPDTPGFPLVQWVFVPSAPGGYREQWMQAQRLLAARRQVRDFRWVEWRDRALCSLSPRWPAEVKAPTGLQEHEKATLSAVGWVKRRFRHIEGDEGFPSTASIASAPYRLAVLEHLADDQVRAAATELRDATREIGRAYPGMARPETAVPGLPVIETELGAWIRRASGPWVYHDQWQPDSLAREAGAKDAAPESVRKAAGRGRSAARRLAARLDQLGVPALASYLAVVVQDLDGMGRFLSGEAASTSGTRLEVTPERHQEISGLLQQVSKGQRDLLRTSDFLSVPVYVGGDDLLAFAPAAKALLAAFFCHEEIPDSLRTSSTAILFFHYHGGLQTALSDARVLLKQAKQRVPGKHALAVGYVRHSGAGASSIQPWDNGASADGFGIFSSTRASRLSPRLVADLDRDAEELARLSEVSKRLYQAELSRLIRRHTEDGAAADEATKVADVLDRLGRHEASKWLEERGTGSWPQLAARVGVFLRQEAR